MAERLFVSRDTLWRLNRGDPSVARPVPNDVMLER
jgi:hypothetical protein